jgi:uncharacterized protein YecT (DUF1311 family)
MKTKPLARQRWEHRLLRAGAYTGACLFLLSSAAQGADPDASPTPDPVDQKVKALLDGAQSTHELVIAAGEGYDLWYQEMNRIYRELMQKLPPGEQTILEKSQEDWISFTRSNIHLLSVIHSKVHASSNRADIVLYELDEVKDRAHELGNSLRIINGL